MSIKSFIAVGAACLASAAFAQNAEPSLGSVGNVQGIVTATDGASVTSTAPGKIIHEGERFVTASNGRVLLQLSNGCNITMEPNQALTIHRDMTCRALIAAIEPVGGVGIGLGAGGFVAAGSPGTGFLAVTGLTIAGFAVHRALDGNSNLSGF